ncbi:MAG: TolC family protein [Candidatus Omnitrophica bacterium]|nr:TolC family protein [Candidatus Omnitrophota bacterium]
MTYTLTDPDRLIVDPVEPQVVSPLPEVTPLSQKPISALHMVRSTGAGSTGSVDYLEFDLTGPVEHLVESTEGMLVIRVRPKGGQEDPPPAAARLPLAEVPQGLPAVAAPLDPPASPERVAAAGGSGTTSPSWRVAGLPPAPAAEPVADTSAWDLDPVMDFALGRHRPVQIGREEVELAQMKVREAKRALYPAATLKSSWTTGTASNVDFREASSGLQVEHPLYYSGRLKEAYRQSLVNLQVAEKRQGKVKADFALEVAQAYLQLIGAKAGLASQGGLMEEVDKFMEQSQARFDKGLLTRLELLNVESQANQAKFQRASAENDLAMARLKFLQRLNMDPNAAEEVPDHFSSAQVPQVDLEEAFQLSDRYRPDIQVNNLLVQFHEHEVRIAKAKGDLKVDLSGFIGSSGAAFESEDLRLKKDYFVGVKATQSWGPHGATASVTDTHTSPRLGQTTRTDSTVYSGELGIYSQLSGLSEVQQALINLEKARNDLEETKQAVFQEVQEAYLSFAKARLQVEYAKQKVAFRQEQLKIIKAQASLNEVLPSQVLEAILRLAEERVGQTQALTNLRVALAKLNKAIGLPGHYR